LSSRPTTFTLISGIDGMIQNVVNFERRSLSFVLTVTLGIAILHALSSTLFSEAPTSIIPSANAQSGEGVRVTDANSGDQFQVEGSLSNGAITNATLYPEHNYIVFDLVTSETDEGELTLILPRSLIDAKSEDLHSDEGFTIVLDNYEAGYVETSSDENQRTIAVLIRPGVVEATIVGTQVLPEFPLAALGALATLVGTVCLLGRTKFFNR
jgi:hypothetical protein